MGKNKLSQVEYDSLVRPYGFALHAVHIRLEALNSDYHMFYQNDPIHHIEERIKSKNSIENKLRRRKEAISCESAKNKLTDIAGTRVICYFTEDVYTLVSELKKQTDLILIKESDYISHPKPNGYRSYHLVLGIPVYNMEGFQYYPVEIQVRTLTMDLWASMEHRICYKNANDNDHANTSNFKRYNELLDRMEEELKTMLV